LSNKAEDGGRVCLPPGKPRHGRVEGRPVTDPNAETRRLLSELVAVAGRLDQHLAAGKPAPFLLLARLGLDIQQMAERLRQHGDALQGVGRDKTAK
jgi:hypothetical protein